jgi:non-canonical (house-cleaning) NTP pyrophosphatase
MSSTVDTIKVAIGSTNPVKLLAASRGIESASSRIVEAEGFDVASGVSDQPFGDDETVLTIISYIAFSH